MNRVVFNLMAVGVFAAAVSAAPRIVIAPAATPYEASASSVLELDFYVDVQDEDGDTVALDAGRSLAIEVAAWSDEESSLTIASQGATWDLPAGFTAGRRSILLAIRGVPPDEQTKAELTLTAAEGGGNPDEVPFAVQIRRSVDEFSRSIRFCIAPGQGSEVPNYNTYSSEIELYRDFGEVHAVGRISAGDSPVDTVGDEFSLQVVEVIDDEEVATTVLETTDVRFTASDADGNGLAEFVFMKFKLAAPKAIEVAPNEAREFSLFAVRADLDVRYHLASILIESRESTFWTGAGLDDIEQRVSFERASSTPLGNPEPRLYVNGILLPEACQVTATVEPSGGNDNIDRTTGLYDLDWKVVIDWVKLMSRTTIVEGDEIRVDLTFPGSPDATISAKETVQGEDD